MFHAVAADVFKTDNYVDFILFEDCGGRSKTDGT
jgi:hypothetical protein